jgi:hypothetical protein
LLARDARLVGSIALVHLVSLVQPNKPNTLNKQAPLPVIARQAATDPSQQSATGVAAAVLLYCLHVPEPNERLAQSSYA